jgi:hypothetical protein
MDGSPADDQRPEELHRSVVRTMELWCYDFASVTNTRKELSQTTWLIRCVTEASQTHQQKNTSSLMKDRIDKATTQIYRILSRNKHVFEMHDPARGENSKVMEVTYVRKGSSQG